MNGNLHAMHSAKPRNFHLPLPEPLHRRLRAAADETGEPTTAVARRAIQAWLDEHDRSAIHESIAEYARSEAGTSADLDRGLEEGAVEHLTRDQRKRKR